MAARRIPSVNMTHAELTAWLANPEHKLASGTVGWQSLRRIVAMLDPARARPWTRDEEHHAKVVEAFNARHLAQATFGRPVAPGLSRRHVALMNWGHDPRKRSSPAYAAHVEWARRNAR